MSLKLNLQLVLIALNKKHRYAYNIQMRRFENSENHPIRPSS